MKKIILSLLILLTGCTVKYELTTIDSLLVNDNFVEDVSITYFEKDGLDYINVDEYLSLINDNRFSPEVRYVSFEKETTEDGLKITSTYKRTEYNISRNGIIKFNYWDYYDTDFQGLHVPVNRSVDVEGVETYFELETIVDIKPRGMITYYKEIDISDWGVEIIEQNGLYLPYHLVDFLFNGFNSHFTYIEGDELHYLTENKSIEREFNLTDNNKRYMLKFYEFMVNNFTYSRKSHEERVNESMKDIENVISLEGDEFYLGFADLISKGGERHNGLHVQDDELFDQIVDNLFESFGVTQREYHGEFEIVEKMEYIYVNLDTFEEDKITALKESIHLKDKPLILDLRENAGGLSLFVFNVISLFNEESTLYLADRYDFHHQQIITSNVDVSDIDVYVLTSNLTYSAASILTQLFKDNTDAVVIGSMTGGGDAAIQHVFLPDGNHLYIEGTSVGMETKDESSIDEGVEPHILIEAELADEKAIEIIKSKVDPSSYLNNESVATYSDDSFIVNLYVTKSFYDNEMFEAYYTLEYIGESELTFFTYIDSESVTLTRNEGGLKNIWIRKDLGYDVTFRPGDFYTQTINIGMIDPESELANIYYESGMLPEGSYTLVLEPFDNMDYKNSNVSLSYVFYVENDYVSE